MDNRAPRDLTGAVRLRRHLLADGYTDQQIRGLVRSGVLHRIRRGAYVSGQLWNDCSREDQHRIRCRAVLVAGHPLMVLTHVSAAIERGVPVWGIALDEVHTTRTDAKSSRREAGVIHHVGILKEEDVEVINGVRVSKAARTAIEVSATSALDATLVVANGMLHLGLITEEELRAEAHQLRYWPETLGNHVLLHLVDKRMGSVAESRAGYLFWSQHLPRPEPQVEVRDEFNDLLGIVDFLWRDLGVFLEFDGKIKYSKFRRPGESLDEYLRREKLREENICQVTGWVCIRISWVDLEHPAATARRIRRLLESRRTALV
jgi:hypothetical protein